MKSVNRMFDHSINSISNRRLQAGRGMPLRITILAICSALALPGIALAKKPVESPVACVIFPPAYIDTGYQFTLKIVRDPAYPGVWSQPIVDAEAVFARTGGGSISTRYSETSSRYGYGVTYVNATLLAPECNGSPCDIDTSEPVVINAVVKEPLNKGKKFRETTCAPATVSWTGTGDFFCRIASAFTSVSRFLYGSERPTYSMVPGSSVAL